MPSTHRRRRDLWGVDRDALGVRRVRAHAHRRRCRPALNVRSLALKLAHVLFNCGMHTASDSTRRSRYKTLWFSVLIYCSMHIGHAPRIGRSTPRMGSLSVCTAQIATRPVCIEQYIGHQGKSKRRRLLCYAGRKSPRRQLDDFEIVMLNSSFI